MRVLHIISENSLLSGIHRHVLNISLEMLAQRDVEVAVCSIFPPGEVNAMIINAGGTSFSLNLKNYKDIRVFWRFHRIVKQFKPDVIHIHVIVFWQWLYLALFARNVRIVRTIHSTWEQESLLKTAFKRLCPMRIHKYFFVSKAVMQFCEGVYDNGAVVYNPSSKLELNKRNELHKLLNLSDNVRVIGTACKIGDVKQPDLFVKAMASVLTTIKDVHAVVIGDGDDTIMLRLKEIVTDYNVEDRFHFVGYQQNAQVLISGLNVFVLTSKREGMPTAVLEAIGAGVPVVFMNGDGGLRDLVDLNHGDDGPFGIDVAAGDCQAVVNGIIRFLSDAEFYRICSRKGNKLCNDRFSVKSVVKQLLNFYGEIV